MGDNRFLRVPVELGPEVADMRPVVRRTHDRAEHCTGWRLSPGQRAQARRTGVGHACRNRPRDAQAAPAGRDSVRWPWRGGRSAAKNLSVDAFPDVTNVQVQVATVAVGRSPEEVERLITVPVEIAMTGLPGLVEMRSMNKSGLSLITLVFTDETDVFFARQLVMERLIEVSRLLPGITPCSGPSSTGLGEVYQYTIEHPDDGERALTFEELIERRTIQDWVVRPMLRSIRAWRKSIPSGAMSRNTRCWSTLTGCATMI